MAPTAQPLTRTHWKLAVAGGMASYLDSGLIVSLGIALPIWSTSFELDAWAIGIISAGLTFAIAVGALFGGRIADLFGRTRVFNIDVLLYLVGAVLILAAPNQAVLVTGVLIAGVAAGADLPTSIAVISERAPAGGQGRMVAFTQVMWTVGIVMATLLGFLFSGLGDLGARFLFAHLAIAALVTWLVRVFSPAFARLEVQTLPSGSEERALPLAGLLRDRRYLAAIGLTALFYIAYGVVANTIGQFKTYFLVEVGGATQTVATGFAFVATLIGLTCAVLFTRAADGPWRNRLFGIGAAGLVAGLLLIVFTGGTILPVVFVFLIVYNLSNPFCGEAVYKVWTQESFPPNVRATVQGITYAIARFVFAGVALVTPALIAWSPSGLFAILAGLAVTSALLGAVLIRRTRSAVLVSA
ncbi:MFS transporter [Curtobacterium sp. 260]|uniref:MFS transporter n=1 Tax=Curtobacterium sp. 260 TaxID=2817748 RepID=UPI00278217E4|nr:MFS transporter [Curtobacterium sp. 260]MDP9736801.1 inositol transporter-like SP family MFS transporter [Curtobacterium sp. 260]